MSIIIPVFNGGDYLREAIDSALAQRYSSIEIIVVNDGSTDLGITEGIAASYGARIRYIAKSNGGCGSALNAGIDAMRGSYFSWLSHDDQYTPDKISHQIALLASLDDRDTVLYGGYKLIDAAGGHIASVRQHESHDIQRLNTPLYPVTRGLLHGCTMLISRRLFDLYGRFDEGLKTTQDYDLWFRLLRNAGIRYDGAINLISRQHELQGSRTISGHVDECDALWISIMRAITAAEAEQTDGSEVSFRRAMVQFLSATPYEGARKHAERLLDEAINRITVSVIIPFHNRIGWTVEAVQSVLNQTHSLLELIVVDDGSTEDVAPLCEIKDARIRYFRTPQSGAAAARNYGVRRATGDYVAFLDSDDLFLPDKIAVQLRHMVINDCAIAHTSYRRIAPNGEKLELMRSGLLHGHVSEILMLNCPIATPTVMGKREVFVAHAFPEHLTVAEDVCTWISITRRHRLAGLDRPLTLVRITATNTNNSSTKRLLAHWSVISFVVANNIYDKRNARMVAKAAVNFIHALGGFGIRCAKRMVRKSPFGTQIEAAYKAIRRWLQ